jgi:hypothetical protein
MPSDLRSTATTAQMWVSNKYSILLYVNGTCIQNNQQIIVHIPWEKWM